MAFSTKLVAILLAAVLASPLMITARKLESQSKSDLMERLKVAEEGPSSCWDALFELQSCSGEVVLFFLNGETRLGANCCGAIKIIEHHCWPSMLGTLGITAEESNVLRGYCDAADNDDDAAAAASSSPPQQSLNFPRLLN